ncbi:aBC transporter ATP-binding protein [Firmicutes bacterium CAG:449]|nr:aBC transporter ATP-binding protein [Firmicutes bacterium CAG:449]
MSSLKIDKLSFSYDKNVVLDNISFEVEKGEYITLMGHNGSGKSTLAKLIMGLLENKNGSIYIDDIEMKESNINELRNKLGIVFQNPDNQFIGATVQDDIAFGLENHLVKSEDMDKIINEFAEKVNMKNFLSKEPSSLSGGQKQRVAIAGVLAMKPEILILDEATSMLDPRGKKEIIDLVHLLRINQKDLTIFSITHDPEEAYLSDKVLVLDQGKIKYYDTPKNVFSHYDELVNMGLDIPFEMKIKNLLIKENIDVSECQNLIEVKEYLCR